MVDQTKRISWFKQRKWRIALVVMMAVLVVWGGLRWDRRRRALYRVTILPTLGGKGSAPRAINDRGQVVGMSQTANGEFHAFLWDRTHGIEDLRKLGGVCGINNAGWIAGAMSDPNEESKAFIRDPNGAVHFLGDLGGGRSTARALSNRNQVTGTSVDAKGLRYAFIWDQANGMRSIMELPGQNYWVKAINDAGQVLGSADTATQLCQPFLWDPNEGLLDIGAIAESVLTLHDRTGLLGQHRISLAKGRFMVLWGKEKGIEELFPLDHGCSSDEILVNDANQVIYTECLPSRWERFGGPFDRLRERRILWDPKQGKINLDRYLPWRLRKSFVPLDMNSQGYIIGYAVKGKETPVGLLLEPIPKKWEK